MFQTNHRGLIVIVGLLWACQTTGYSDDFQKIAVIDDPHINESSGLAASYTHANAVWIHNDSGDLPRVFLVGLDGKTKAVVRIGGADAVDWEDMCSFRFGNESWLLIGDVGDNDNKRGGSNAQCRLYLLKEPVIPRSDGVPKVLWNVSATIELTYEDGPANCEGVAVDTERREILLLSKSAPHQCGLYVLPLNVSAASQRQTARRIASPFVPFATALDISPSGRTMVVGSMLNGLVISRQADQSWADAFSSEVLPLPLPVRRQGETIGFDPSGQWLYLNSEHTGQPLWRVPCP